MVALQGLGGSDRVVLTWDAATAVRNAWLQVTVLASPADTGLLADDVFYFGHFTGDVNDAVSPGFVTAADLTAIRNHPRGVNNPAGIDNRYDINRDAAVDAVDLILARNNVDSPLDALAMISPPMAAAAPPPLLQGISGEPMVPSDWFDGEEPSAKQTDTTGDPLLIDLLLASQ